MVLRAVRLAPSSVSALAAHEIAVIDVDAAGKALPSYGTGLPVLRAVTAHGVTRGFTGQGYVMMRTDRSGKPVMEATIRAQVREFIKAVVENPRLTFLMYPSSALGPDKDLEARVILEVLDEVGVHISDLLNVAWPECYIQNIYEHYRHAPGLQD